MHPLKEKRRQVKHKCNWGDPYKAAEIIDLFSGEKPPKPSTGNWDRKMPSPLGKEKFSQPQQPRKSRKCRRTSKSHSCPCHHDRSTARAAARNLDRNQDSQCMSISTLDSQYSAFKMIHVSQAFPVSKAAAEGLAAIGSKARCESQEFIAHSHFVRIDGSRDCR